jgi:hypothetical protein
MGSLATIKWKLVGEAKVVSENWGVEGRESKVEGRGAACWEKLKVESRKLKLGAGTLGKAEIDQAES